MRKAILLLILFISCLTGFSQEPIEVMVLMKDHYDRTQLCRRAEFYPTRVERRDFVVKELKDFTEASQYDIMLTLNELEQHGLVSSVQSLWSANAIYFTATEEVIQMLSECPDVKCPIPNNVRVPGGCPPPYLDPDQMEIPGGLSCVVAVGAVTENDTATTFTSHGPVTWQDTEFSDYPYEPGMGLIRPDVCAPGDMIWSLDNNNIQDYDYRSGTSQATPCVAGIVALMLHANPELTPAAICQILEETALKLTPNKSNITGLGRVDALAAVQAAALWDAVDEYTDSIDDTFDASTQRIFDLTGRVITSKNLSPGIYIIQQIEGNQVKTRKIVVR